jgi:hypothetical protein
MDSGATSTVPLLQSLTTLVVILPYCSGRFSPGGFGGYVLHHRACAFPISSPSFLGFRQDPFYAKTLLSSLSTLAFASFVLLALKQLTAARERLLTRHTA